ncbi:MAG: methyltransferase domain-containing protein [Alphaproteobacteria bacterium]|nr:methyltransferase domain-containing protein [Alphaproteobacteria bacterium]MBU1525163.1 methyltransferase domain-containing protein [Alphaproteobacteria bacterium]MBU2117483.1 methyltransferase domain-containing protein [Alphaproteobacteria bacterium]MBU2352159.1 methyltransferase domain-containing protein [Alphaproteobacteria bacterium]MBU2381169.1 methyltransferase domain-containing protein [Alphaproteobacteria bacterium]
MVPGLDDQPTRPASLPGLVRSVLTRAGRAAGHALSPRILSERVTRARFGRRVHQSNSLTWLGRYPVLFGAAQELLSHRQSLRILSYGCSSGEEVETLRHHFPDAVLVGADINRAMLRRCRRLDIPGETWFEPSDDRSIERHAPFDAIFCMAVFTRRPHEVERRALEDIGQFYPFDTFSRDLRRLAALLTPGGLLIVEHALYRAEDALANLPFTALTSHGFGPAKGPRFAPSGQRLEPPQLISRIFRAVGRSAGQTPFDL